MDFKIPSDPVEEKPVEMNPAPQPLVHTISFYRNMTKAQNTPTHNKPVRVETPKQLSPTKAGAKPTSYRAENYKEKMRVNIFYIFYIFTYLFPYIFLTDKVAS